MIGMELNGASEGPLCGPRIVRVELREAQSVPRLCMTGFQFDGALEPNPSLARRAPPQQSGAPKTPSSCVPWL